MFFALFHRPSFISSILASIWPARLRPMEEEFDIGEVREEDLATLSTVGDCVNYLTNKLD